MPRIALLARASLLAAAFSSIGTSALHAQRLQPRTQPVRRTESFSLTSSTMGGRVYDISVGRPAESVRSPSKKFPAIITLDGYEYFTLTQNIADMLTGQGNTEGVFIISIGAPSELGEQVFTRRRVHEFSPMWAMNDDFGKLVKGLCASFKVEPPQAECVGGAPKFLDVIVKELLPLIAEKYPIDTSRLGLFGVSAGGFFASWAIFQPTSPFKNYIISSPAMAYGDGEIFRQEASYAQSHKDLPVGIYMASGSLEMDDPQLEGIGKIVSGHTHLVGTLMSHKYPGLKLFTEIHDGYGHVDSAAPSFTRGLRLLYAKSP